MKIGIKYCGGCNPRYQREAEVEKLKKKLPDCNFTYDSSEVCNVWIAVHGCPSACAHKEMLKAKDGILEAVKARDFVQIAKKIQEKLYQSVHCFILIVTGILCNYTVPHYIIGTKEKTEQNS